MRALSVLPLCCLIFAAAAPPPALAADDAPAYGPQLQGFEYPWPVSHFSFTSQGETLDMAYMDVKADGAGERRYRCAVSRQEFLRGDLAGHDRGPDRRRLARHCRRPDRFLQIEQACPLSIYFSATRRKHACFARVAGDNPGNFHRSLGRRHARHALRHDFSGDVEQLVLVDPIGLEDWKAKGVPWQSVDNWYAQELTTSADSIRDYQRVTYYAGSWDPKYDRWVEMLAGLYRGPGHDIVAWNAALVDDMAFTQPVFYEFERIAAPVLLIVGDKDTTAIGKNFAPPEIRPTLGNYPILAKAAVARFPHGKLVEFPELGHAPQIQAPDVFHKALLDGLRK